MLQLTIRDLLLGKADNLADDYNIYVIRDGECVLYVGRSVDVIRRLNEHITQYSSSSIGQLIRINRPTSYQWQVELMSTEECRPFVYQFWQNYQEKPDGKIAMETAEMSMIMHYHPCRNTSNNLTPNPLPKHIKQWEVEIEAGATDNLF